MSKKKYRIPRIESPIVMPDDLEELEIQRYKQSARRQGLPIEPELENRTPIWFDESNPAKPPESPITYGDRLKLMKQQEEAAARRAEMRALYEAGRTVKKKQRYKQSARRQELPIEAELEKRNPIRFDESKPAKPRGLDELERDLDDLENHIDYLEEGYADRNGGSTKTFDFPSPEAKAEYEDLIRQRDKLETRYRLMKQQEEAAARRAEMRALYEAGRTVKKKHREK